MTRPSKSFAFSPKLLWAYQDGVGRRERGLDVDHPFLGLSQAVVHLFHARLPSQVPDEEQREQHDRNDQEDIRFHHMQEMHDEGDDSGDETGNGFPLKLEKFLHI